MRPVCFAAILLFASAAAAEAHADAIPLTVSGTEIFSFESVPDGNSFETAPSVSITGTGLYDPGDGFPGITVTLDVDLVLFPQSTYIPLDADGGFEQDFNPDYAVTFHYNPNGLSSGSFFYELHDNTGYIDPSGNFLPGINFIDVYGTLTPTVTPEPSTVTLLGTGLLIAAGRFRKRFRR